MTILREWNEGYRAVARYPTLPLRVEDGAPKLVFGVGVESVAVAELGVEMYGDPLND
jgi:hypothetical protein